MGIEPFTFTDPADVEAALLSDLLVPPPPPATLAASATADLRNAMARFSSPGPHQERRAAVDRQIAAISHHPFTAEAQRRTALALASSDSRRGIEAASDIGFVVPVETLAGALGVHEQACESVRNDVRAVAKVIGRGEPAGPESDEAAIRLAQRFSGADEAHVAPISLLYQIHDAGAALFASVLLANQTGTRRRPAVSVTARVAASATTIGSTELPQGAHAVIDLESSRFEFGLGAHGCPGRSIAERIVAGMLHAIDLAGFELSVDAVQTKPDGRPNTLPLSRRVA